MKTSEFLARLEEIIDAQPGALKGDEILSEVQGWDSLAVVAFIALADEHFGIAVAPRSIQKSQTIADLLALLGDRIES